MEKKNWFVITTYHERYSLETLFYYAPNKTFDEVVDELFIDTDDMEVREENHFYIIDQSCRNPMTMEKFKYSYPKIKDMTGLAHIHLDATMIVSEEYMKKEEYAAQIWGDSDSKFGLLDYNREGSINND
jgi:hypothetical protein